MSGVDMRTPEESMDAANPSHPKTRRAGLRRKPRVPGTEVYWVSLAAREDGHPFAEIRKGAVVPNAMGKALASAWRELRKRHGSLVGDIMAVGPHSLHGILFISHRGSENLTLTDAVRLFKALSGRRISDLSKLPASKSGGLWKKGYTERAINGAKELSLARKALKAGLKARKPLAVG
jgi:hypothetical protein